MADISQIKLPNGSIYSIKDAFAREQISSILGNVTGVMRFVGITTTELTDGAEISSVMVEGEEVLCQAGDVAIYGETEFIYNGSKWQAFGSSTGVLKALAFKDTASAEYTPSGEISAPTFNGTAGDVTVSYTPSGNISIDAFTPQGNCSAPETTVTLNTTTVNSIENVGSLPEVTTSPKMTATVAENTEVLELKWTDMVFSQGTLPTKGGDTVVATSVKTATTTAPVFTGDAGNITGSFTGTAGEGTGSFTPSGTVTAPDFTGQKVTITVS